MGFVSSPLQKCTVCLGELKVLGNVMRISPKFCYLNLLLCCFRKLSSYPASLVLEQLLELLKIHKNPHEICE